MHRLHLFMINKETGKNEEHESSYKKAILLPAIICFSSSLSLKCEMRLLLMNNYILFYLALILSSRATSSLTLSGYFWARL